MKLNNKAQDIADITKNQSLEEIMNNLYVGEIIERCGIKCKKDAILAFKMALTYTTVFEEVINKITDIQED